MHVVRMASIGVWDGHWERVLASEASGTVRLRRGYGYGYGASRQFSSESGSDESNESSGAGSNEEALHVRILLRRFF